MNRQRNFIRSKRSCKQRKPGLRNEANTVASRILIFSRSQFMLAGLREAVAPVVRGARELIEIGSGEDTAIAQVLSCKPQVVIWHLQQHDSISKSLIAAARQGSVVVLRRDLSYIVDRLLREGVKGLLFETCSFAELADIVRKVVNGSVATSPAMSEFILREALHFPAEQRNTALLLTTRERKVVELTAKGKTNKETAKCLGIGPGPWSRIALRRCAS